MVTVCVVKVRGCYLSAVFAIKDILEYANDLCGPIFDVSLCGPREFRLARKRFAYVIIPPFRAEPRGAELRPDRKLVAALARAAAHGTIPVSVCAGAFYLCETGVVDGRCVTTHWQLADRLAARFPRVTVQKERVLIDDGASISTGGITSYHDLSLYLVKKHVSADAALDVARVFLINPGDRTQLQYVKMAIDSPSTTDTVALARSYMHERLADPLSLRDIARRCRVTVRTLQRRFAVDGADGPAAHLRSMRLAHARRLLETSAEPVKQVAADCGYRDVPSFTRAFRRATGVPPAEYRKRFHVAA